MMSLSQSYVLDYQRAIPTYNMLLHVPINIILYIASMFYVLLHEMYAILGASSLVNMKIQGKAALEEGMKAPALSYNLHICISSIWLFLSHILLY